MIFLAIIEELYFISHCSKQSRAETLFVCSTDFLSDNVFRQIHLLASSSHKNDQSLFLEIALTIQQDKEVESIFRKLNQEKHSGYAFTEQLQQTYLMEIIHLITRVHGSKSVMIEGN